MQFRGPSLRSFANFHVEIERFCGSLSAEKYCVWIIMYDDKSSGFKMFFKTSLLAYRPHFFVQIPNPHDLSNRNNIFIHVRSELHVLQDLVQIVTGY